MLLQALFHVNDILERRKDGETTSQVVRLNAVYDSNPDSPNHAFWQATPSGQLEMTINNPAAFDFFVTGQKYLVEFTLFKRT